MIDERRAAIYCARWLKSFRKFAVIVIGTQARVDRIAARQGLVMRKRLPSGAVFDVPGHRLHRPADVARRVLPAE